MRSRTLVLALFAIIPGLANGEEPAPPASAAKTAPALSDERKQERKALLETKVAELKRLQAEIKQLRDELSQQQQIGLELQVFEVSQTKLRNMGFDWDNIKKMGSSPGRDASGFCTALCKNNLAKVFAERKTQTPNGSAANFMLDDGSRTALTFDCTPTALDSGNIRMAVKFEITRFAGEDFGLRVRAGETTIEVEPDTAFVISGDSIKRTKANGDKDELDLVFVIKPYLPKR